MSGVEFIPFAFSIAQKVEELTEYLIKGLYDTVQFGSGAEKTRLSLGLEASSFKSIKRVLFGNAADGSFLGIFPEFDQQTQLDLINVLRLFSESLEKL